MEHKSILSIKKGALYATLAALSFAILGASMQYAQYHTTQPVVIFFRQVFSLAALSPFLMWQVGRKRSSPIKTQKLGTHIVRTIFSLLQLYALIYALSVISLSDAILLSYTRPLFIPIIIWIWYKKKLKKWIWLGLFLGFVGTAFIIKPEGSVFHIGAIIGLLSGFFGACSNISMRKLAKTDPPHRILFYFFALSILISAIPLVWSWSTPQAWLWGLLFLIGVIGSIYQFALALSYRFAKPSYISGFLYFAIVFTMIYEWIYQGIVPDLYSIVGTILIFAGTMVVSILGTRYHKGVDQAISKTMPLK
ncbi:MAG: pseudopaline transport inner membrane protein CntI [Simkaniaceae bacterium]